MTEIVIGNRYYWKRANWSARHSGVVTVVAEGGSNRVKGWQVKYEDTTDKEFPDCTEFATEDELFDLDDVKQAITSSRVEQLENLRLVATVDIADVIKHIIPLLQDKKKIAYDILRSETNYTEDQLKVMQQTITYYDTQILQIMGIKAFYK